jgi:hypothetical protein
LGLLSFGSMARGSLQHEIRAVVIRFG